MLMKLLPLLFLILASPRDGAADGATGLQTPEEIQQCSRQNEPKHSAKQTIELISVDRIGAETKSKANLYWLRDGDGRSKIMVRILEPPDLRLAGLLVIEKEPRADMFLYMPELEKVRRVTKHMASGSLFGTDFTYEDFSRIQGFVKDKTVERLEDQEVEGRGCYVLGSRPGPEDTSAYEKVVTFIDRETCIPLRIEMYEFGDRLRKRIEIDFASVKEVGGIQIPHLIKAVDVRDQTESTLTVKKVEIDKDVPRKYFTTRWLESGRQ